LLEISEEFAATKKKFFFSQVLSRRRIGHFLQARQRQDSACECVEREKKWQQRNKRVHKINVQKDATGEKVPPPLFDSHN
jgi:hypothetical protein